MTNKAPFKHKQGLQGRKPQGRQIDGGGGSGGEGAILQLETLQGAKINDSLAPWSATWISPSSR